MNEWMNEWWTDSVISWGIKNWNRRVSVQWWFIFKTLCCTSHITAYEIVFALFVTVNQIGKSLFNHTIGYISVSLALFHSSIHCHLTVWQVVSMLCVCGKCIFELLPILSVAFRLFFDSSLYIDIFYTVFLFCIERWIRRLAICSDDYHW